MASRVNASTLPQRSIALEGRIANSESDPGSGGVAASGATAPGSPHFTAACVGAPGVPSPRLASGSGSRRRSEACRRPTQAAGPPPSSGARAPPPPGACRLETSRTGVRGHRLHSDERQSPESRESGFRGMRGSLKHATAGRRDRGQPIAIRRQRWEQERRRRPGTTTDGGRRGRTRTKPQEPGPDSRTARSLTRVAAGSMLAGAMERSAGLSGTRSIA